MRLLVGTRPHGRIAYVCDGKITKLTDIDGLQGSCIDASTKVVLVPTRCRGEVQPKLWKSPWALGFMLRSVHWLKAASEAGFAMAQKNLALAEGLRPQEDATYLRGNQLKLPSWL